MIHHVSFVTYLLYLTLLSPDCTRTVGGTGILIPPKLQPCNVVARQEPPNSDGKHPMIIGAGGLNGRYNIADSYGYFIAGKVWCILPSLPRARSGNSMFVYKGEAYVIGGYSDETGYVGDVLKLSLLNNSWTIIPSLEIEPGAAFAVVSLADSVYVVGGSPNPNRVLVLLANGTWQKRASTKYQHSYSGIAELDEKIYVCGADLVEKVCEVYDPVLNIWSLIAPTNDRRENVVMTSLNRHLWITGGSNTTERFDPKTNSWTFVETAPKTINFCATVNNGNDMVILGGCSHELDFYYNEVEQYNTVEDKWSLAVPYPVAVGFFGAVNVNISSTLFQSDDRT